MYSYPASYTLCRQRCVLLAGHIFGRITLLRRADKNKLQKAETTIIKT